MKPCFGYIRVSTQKQGEGVSLEAQKDAITVFASRNDLTITRWFEEKETAAKSGRPVFNGMLKQLKQGKADGVIIHKIDRSARNLRDWAMFSELPDAGVSVFVATESLDFNSRGGRLTADIQAVIAADYIRNLREECIKGIEGRLKQGLYPFRAPIGYRDNGRGKPKTPCPEKAPLIKQLFELYASGEHSINSLQVEMATRGLRNHAGQAVSKHGIETILRNSFYCGVIYIRRTGRTYQGCHHPLISVRRFEQVQARKAGRAGKKVTRHNHLYRGLFRCGSCKKSMIPERQKGHVYYRCQNSACPKNIIREDRLEAAILSALKRVKPSSATCIQIREKMHAWIEGDDRRQLLSSLDLRLHKAKERQGRLIDLLLDGMIDREAHDERRQSLALEIQKTEQERSELLRSELDPETLEKFLELTTSLAELHVRLERPQKRQLVENCFSNLVVTDNEPLLEPHSWLRSPESHNLTPLVNHIGPLLELLSTTDLLNWGKSK
ncbi:MAG: recombinase family protein [Pseudomonadota bacterium]